MGLQTNVCGRFEVVTAVIMKNVKFRDVCVVLVRTDILEEHITSIFRVKTN
jgi:hypothetical protein